MSHVPIHSQSDTVQLGIIRRTTSEEHKIDESDEPLPPMTTMKRQSTRERPVLSIFAKLNIKRIANVSTIDQSFDVEFSMGLAFEAFPEDLERCEEKWSQFEPSWTPSVSFPGASHVDDGSPEKLWALEKKNGVRYVVYQGAMTITYQETFALENFPFDCQDLIIKIRIKDSKKRFKLELKPFPMKSGKSFARINNTNSLLSEWTVHPPIIELGGSDPRESKSGESFPVIRCRLKVARQWQYYLKRIVLLTALLSLSTLSTFALDTSDLSSRLSTDFIVLLTMVAFQYSVMALLPVLPFLTLLDMYMLASFAFVVIIIIGHVEVALLKPSLQDQYDRFWLIGTCAMWVIAHICGMVYCPVVRDRETAKLRLNSEHLSEYMFRSSGEKDFARTFEFFGDDMLPSSTRGYLVHAFGMAKSS